MSDTRWRQPSGGTDDPAMSAQKAPASEGTSTPSISSPQSHTRPTTSTTPVSTPILLSGPAATSTFTSPPQRNPAPVQTNTPQHAAQPGPRPSPEEPAPSSFASSSSSAESSNGQGVSSSLGRPTPPAMKEKSTSFPEKGKHRTTLPRLRAFIDVLAEEPEKVPYESAPWVARPDPESRDPQVRTPWLKEEQEATEWLSLFYDLVVVAVLTVFSTSHELAEPKDIPIFLSYFVVIYWTWVSQSQFDMRFQANDWINRFFKFLQITAFLYSGAAAGNWDPKYIQTANSAGVTGRQVTLHEGAERSFVTVLSAYVITRVLLAVQYGVTALVGRKVGRRVSQLWITLVALLISAVFGLIAVAIKGDSRTAVHAKLGIFYTGMGLEVLFTWWYTRVLPTPPFLPIRIAERYGAFLLIILGEAIISILKAVNNAVSGLSNTDASTYAQAFLAVLILYLLFLFMFLDFKKDHKITERRAVLWTSIHFPLCFGLLLLQSAIVNEISVLGSAGGIVTVAEALGNLSINNIPQNSTVPSTFVPNENDTYIINTVLNKVDVSPDWVTELNQLQQLYLDDSPSSDPNILFTQYMGQVVESTLQLYGRALPGGAQATYNLILALNTTYIEEDTERDEVEQHAGELLAHMINEAISEGFSGLQWLLPASGGVLILSAFRSLTWFHWQGLANTLTYSLQLLGGLALALLGLLDIGPKDFTWFDVNLDYTEPNYNPLYDIASGWQGPLVLTAMVYFVVYAGSTGTLWLVDVFERRKKRADAGKRDLAVRRVASRGEEGIEEGKVRSGQRGGKEDRDAEEVELRKRA